MKTLKFFIFFLVLVLFSCQNTKEKKETIAVKSNEPKVTPILSQKQLIKIDSICQSFIAKGNTVGFSVGLAHNGKVIFSEGYGLANIVTKKQATDSTIYPIASISKLVTAIATLKMVEEGKLSLDDKVVDHIKNFPQQDFMDEITIEHLLRHQSGLVDYEDWYDDIFINQKREYTDKEFYRFLNQPLFFRPGTHYSYSNSGYAILSKILEKVSQSSFHQMIREKIGKPLRLHSVGIWHKQWNDKNASIGYELVDQKIDTSFHMMTKGMKGDGGLSASVLELLKIADALTDGSLISQSSLEQMLSPTPIGKFHIDSGLGTKSGTFRGHKTYGHSGGYKGTLWSNLTHYPESGITFASMMNTNFSPDEIMMLRHLIMPVVFNIKAPNLKEKAIANIEKFTGEYESLNRWGKEKASKRNVSIRDGALIWDNPDTETPGIQLYPVDENRFSWKPYPYDEFKFHEVDGEIMAVSEYYDGSFGMLRMKQKTNIK